ncbi:MAG TPA: hypothetical protein VFK04_01520 [Gemmatimonadaceae bacterium]|nr:hypothetical protein [Gemmatimonadaceae bacterium]
MIAQLLLASLALFAPRQDTLPAAPPPDAGTQPVQMGVLVRPDTVTVGEHFQVLVRVRAPRGSQISFPPGPDSGLTVEAVDPRELRESPDSSFTEETAVYTLVAWDTGWQASRLGDLVVTTDGADRRVTITGDSVRVRSVLPADSTLRVPKPARDIVVAGRPWWHWLLAALAALALVALIFWWWRRRRRHAPENAGANAYETAVREFERIASLGLIEAGEPGRYVALNTDAARDYLAARLGDDAQRSLTSSELLASVAGRAEVDPRRLAPLLAESDLIKFARRPVTGARARELGAEARGVVDDVESAVKAEEERAARAAAEGADAEAGRAA